VLILAVFLTLILAAGCVAPQKKKQPQQGSQAENQIQVNAELAGRAKEAAGTVGGVRESAAVALNKDLAIAVKVGGFDRLRLKPIRSQVHDSIKELEQAYNVHVTTDKKLFMQLQQIEQELNGAQEKPLKELQVKFNKLMQDMLR
jgi:hypothetical protein